MLTPVDIHNKEFKRSFRGFNEEEVDDFLDQVVTDYEKLYRENAQLRKELELNDKQLGQYHQLEKNLQDTLLVAQRTADEVTSTANSRAEETRQAAREAAENLKKEAELVAKRRIDEAADQVRQIVAEYERLVTEKRQFVAKMRNALNTEIALLGEVEAEMPDKPKVKIQQYTCNQSKEAETVNDNVTEVTEDQEISVAEDSFSASVKDDFEVIEKPEDMSEHTRVMPAVR